MISRRVLIRFCDSTTPLSKLLARRRWSMFIVMAAICAGIGMLESGVELLLFGSSIVVNVILLGCLLVAAVLGIPAILLIPVVAECEKELLARQALPQGYRSLDDRIPAYAVRMIIAFFISILIASVHNHRHPSRDGNGYDFSKAHDAGR